jgi:hypothetical protein
MTTCRRRGAMAGALLACAAAGAGASDPVPSGERALSGSLTGYAYVLPDEPNFGMAVGAADYGSLHLEGRYNYEARASVSAFAGRTFSGGGQVTYEVTPIVGVLFGRVHGFVPGVEAGLAYRSLDAYVEAEYVFDRNASSDNYFYAWSEVGWKPIEWLRIGIVGQRTRMAAGDRDIQRGLLMQVFAGRLTLSAYAFNPDLASRYAMFALGIDL